MDNDVRQLYISAQNRFGEYVHGVRSDQWHLSTPCTDWDVHRLVNHVLGEICWAVPLFAGRTIAEVGDRFDGDLLGDDPVAAWDAATPPAIAAVQEPGAMDRTVHLSFGDFPGSEYAMQLFADLLVHGWDLARATGQDERMDPDQVTACATWFADRAAAYREFGAVGARCETGADAGGQSVLLAEFGRR
jgi:uncharacterized protein (TIGR03086 family)